MEQNNGEAQLETLPFARNYQLEALEMAVKQNTIVYLETGSGKTLIAIMLLRNYAHFLRKPSPFIAVFLVPKVVLVEQQAKAVRAHTDFSVGMYWGAMGVDHWCADTWRQEIKKHEVLVMTPQILLNGLRHSLFKLEMLKVLIMDECHHACGKHHKDYKDPYALIMKEFYHRHLSSGSSNLPRIFGMTASPIKTQGCKSELAYWSKIRELEDIMKSKVYTCASESVLAEFIPFSKPKFKMFQDVPIPDHIHTLLEDKLIKLREKHECSIRQLDLSDSVSQSAHKKLSKIFSTLKFCLDELGAWLAFKAAVFLSSSESDFYWESQKFFREDKILKSFSSDASHEFAKCIKDDHVWTIGDDVKSDVCAGLITEKVVSLIDILLEYRHMNSIRCIVFVERVITAVALKFLLSDCLGNRMNWKTEYIAGNNSTVQYQSRKIQNNLVEEFKKGVVNIIVATSILEEGLDVQSCNLVIRFDPCTTVSSFIQSRGRARMQNSDYVLMVKSGDLSTRSRLEKYLSSGEIMRRESRRHAGDPCSLLLNDLDHDEYYEVESTGAMATINSSISLIYFYCSRLPSDSYFKPSPRFHIDEGTETCTLYLPKSCPVLKVKVHGNLKTIRQKACLEACKQLHACGALTDHLIPDIVIEEDIEVEAGNDLYEADKPIYFPSELASEEHLKKANYFCYIIGLTQHFDYDLPVSDVVLALRSELDPDISSFTFDLEADRGSLSVQLKYVGVVELSAEQVNLCRRFQITLFRILLDHGVEKLDKALTSILSENRIQIDYLLLPSMHKSFDWNTISSLLFPRGNAWKDHKNCPLTHPQPVHTKDGLVCKCMLENSVICTPHNGRVYCITGTFHNLNGKSQMKLRSGGSKSYTEYYKKRYQIVLAHDFESLICGRQMFSLPNLLHNQVCRGQDRERKLEARDAYVELPPELCSILMSPIAVTTVYSFTLLPSIMHRIESLMTASNFKKMHLDHSMQDFAIPSIKVLEAITTKKCQEPFHLESLETLGDSFLKYAAGQQLFQSYQTHHEGLLSIKKDKIVCNDTLCKLGCKCKLPGFIRDEPFNPRSWLIPGDNSGSSKLDVEFLSEKRKIFVRGNRKLKNKRIADVVEALIGAYLSTGGETAALLFMDWLGIKMDLIHVPYKRDFEVQSEIFLNVSSLQSLLNYSFKDPSLLVEALTHGSYMVPEIPRCYQRLEFLGDAVLDYLITEHLYEKYPGLSPGLLTDMRSASVNNDCYARSSVKAGLHKHILHASHELHKHIVSTVVNYNEVSQDSTFGWESEMSFPKVLGDIIESLAGAILVDSGYDKKVVFRSIRPLLEPLVTPESVRLHPVRELNEFCQEQHFKLREPAVTCENGKASVTVEVEANGRIFKHTAAAADKKTAKKVAAKEVFAALKFKRVSTLPEAVE